MNPQKQWLPAGFLPLAVLSSVFAALNAISAEDTDARPNIVLLMSDDQAWHDTGYYGHPHLKTPNLDAMAANGLRFDRFYVAASKCSPTRASVMTGRNPFRFNFLNGIGFPGKERTIAELMSAAGYRTGHFGKWHLGKVDADHPSNPAKRGFDYYRSCDNQFGVDPVVTGEDGQTYALKGEGSVAVIREALNFIEDGTKRGTPTLTVVWFASPHAPHQPHNDDLAAIPKEAGARNYLAEIFGIDRAAGLMRRRLRELQIEKNTLVVFNADNGFTTPHAKLKGGKETLWEGGVRVPGVAEWPGRIEPGTVTQMPVSTMDLAPTAAALAGIKQLEMTGPVDGIDLTPLFDGEMKSRPRPVPIAYFNGVGLITEQYKIIRGEPSHREYRKLRGAGTDQPWHFYDLEHDPKEANNLVENPPPEFHRLKSQLEVWMTGTR